MSTCIMYMNKRLPNRAWFYFRMGWSTYLVFLFAAINTLVVTYYLAIEKIPILVSIFPSFTHYVGVAMIIVIPLAITIGYIHFKKSLIFSSEVDVGVESNPYNFKLVPGHHKEVLFPILHEMIDFLINEYERNDNPDKVKKLKKLREKTDILIDGGTVGTARTF